MIGLAVDPSTQTQYFFVNNLQKPFDELAVRQAINHAIDRAGIVRAVLSGFGRPANSFMARGAVDYDSKIPVPKYNLALARQWLRKSSVPNGFAFDLQVAAGDVARNEVAVIVKSDLAQIGITVNIQQLDPTVLHTDRNTFKYTVTQGPFIYDIPDPDEIVATALDYSQTYRSFWTHYNSAQAVALSHRAERVTNAATRKKIYYKLQEMWASQVPFLTLYYAPFVNAVSKQVHGFAQTPLGYFKIQGVRKG